MHTRINRDLHGAWQANTRVMLDDKNALRISTHKVSSGALVTSATHVTCDDNGFESFIVFQNFHKMVIVKRVRVTENAVKAQHDAVLLMLDSLKDEMNEYYRNKQAA